MTTKLFLDFFTLSLPFVFYKILIFFVYTIQFIALFFTLYSTAISYLGFRRRKISSIKEPQKRFAIVIPAHNEENVIGQTIESIKALDYPRELYDIFVVCDNCIDKTEEIAKEKKVITLKRSSLKTGKGNALEWAFARLWEVIEKNHQDYDAIVMFDADNLVNKNFLNIINTKLLEGHEVVQSYLDSKNPKDTWVTQSYAFSYWATNRTFQLSRENLGLSAQLGGTGVVISTQILKEIGWEARSLTEDLEFTQRYILKTGKRVAWAHEAKVYDEKPLTFLASWKQRIRWMSGHADCMVRYTFPLIKKAWTEKSLICLDSALYLLQPSRIMISAVLIIFTVFSFLNLFEVHGLINKWIYLFVTLFYHGLPIIGLILEKRAHAIWWIVKTYIFSFSWIPVVLIGIIRRKNSTWIHTEHTRNISIEEVEDSLTPEVDETDVLIGDV